MTDNTSNTTSRLLRAGVIAGPMFIILSLVQGALREGYDPVRHPASMLSLGSAGFVQIANFVLTGLLFIAFAVGVKRVLTDGVGRTWASRMLLLVGISFIMGGVFVADPALGFPPGAPTGVPQNMSTSGMIHGVAPILGSFAMSAALLIFARRFWKEGQKGAALVAIVVTVASFVLSSIPQMTADWENGVFNFVPLWIGVTLFYSYPILLVSKLKKSYAIA
jgi:hypothetical protein